MLQEYSFATGPTVTLADDMSVALHDVLECLKRASQFQHPHNETIITIGSAPTDSRLVSVNTL